MIPEWRFPEFKGKGEWENHELGLLTYFVNERIAINKLSLSDYISTENILPDYAGVTTASKLPLSGSAVKYRINDILISNIRPYLKKVWFSNKNGGASNDVIVLQPRLKRLKYSKLTKKH